MGGGRRYYVPASTPGSSRDDELDLLAMAKDTFGYRVIQNRSDFDSLSSDGTACVSSQSALKCRRGARQLTETGEHGVCALDAAGCRCSPSSPWTTCRTRSIASRRWSPRSLRWPRRVRKRTRTRAGTRVRGRTRVRTRVRGQGPGDKGWGRGRGQGCCQADEGGDEGGDVRRAALTRTHRARAALRTFFLFVRGRQRSPSWTPRWRARMLPATL